MNSIKPEIKNEFVLLNHDFHKSQRKLKKLCF